MTACVWVCVCAHMYHTQCFRNHNSHSKIAETVAAHCSGCNAAAVNHVSYKKMATLRDGAVSDLHVIRTAAAACSRFSSWERLMTSWIQCFTRCKAVHKPKWKFIIQSSTFKHFFSVLKLTSTKCGLKEEMKNLPSEGQAINREVIHVWEQMKLTLQSDKQGWAVHQKSLLGNAWRSLVSQTSRIQASVLPTQSSPV